MLTLKDSIELHRQGRLEEAEHGYRALVASEPDNLDAVFMLAVARRLDERRHRAALHHPEPRLALPDRDPVRRQPILRVAPTYHDEPAYIDALAASIREAVAALDFLTCGSGQTD